MSDEYKANLLKELERLHKRNEMADTIAPDYYEPGMMEYLDKVDGLYDPSTGNIVVRFESKGTRYDGRTEQIEKVKMGDPITIKRDKENPYNSNNFILYTRREQDVGNMPADLCNVIAPLYDSGDLEFIKASVSYAEPISKRSRYAKQAMLFVETKLRISKE